MPQVVLSDKLLTRVTVSADVVASAIAYLLALDLTARAAPSLGVSLVEPKGVAGALLWPVLATTLVIRRPSTSSGLAAGLDLYSTALTNSFTALLATSLVAFVLSIDARWLVLGLTFVLPVMLIAARWALRQFLRFGNRSVDEPPTALLVGVHPELETTLKRETSLGFRPVSVASITSADELELAIQSFNASAVVLDRYSGTIAELRELVWRADDHCCKVMLASPIGMVSPNDVVVLPTSTHDLTVLATASLRPAARFTKRLFDLFVAPVAILVVSPVLLITLIVVAITDGFPVFYRATRIGVNGRTFQMIKIRTMSIALDVENAANELSPSASMHSIKFESHRTTRVGRTLRRWSLDELPQLFHVVAGTMSLVGPRPRLPHEHSHEPLLLRRLKVKPGITGLWQVSGRGDLPLAQAAELDVRYVDSWSLFGDVVILLRTLKTVITGQGAR